MERQKHVRTMSKAAACALIALCSATDFLSAADDSPTPSYIDAKRAACTADNGIMTQSGPRDNRITTCCNEERCEVCQQDGDGENESCFVTCNVGQDECCAIYDACRWYEYGAWYLVVVDPADESGLPGIDELQADDSLVVLDEGEQYTPIGDSEVLIGEFFVFEDDLEEYTPIGDSEEFVWQYTPIGDSEDYIWAYIPIGYEMEEVPQSLFDTLRGEAADFELQAEEDQTVVETEDSEPQDDEGELVVETSDESTPEQDTTNPGGRRRNDRSRRHGGRN
jgi:hypothetical protein